jgi:hypothetical protein
MRASKNALRFLADEHVLLRQLFDDFERPRANDPRRSEDIVLETVSVLCVYVQIEEEMFYPAAAAALADEPHADAVMAEAGLSRAAIARAMANLEVEPPLGPELGMRFARLADIARLHFADQEERLFPLLRRSGVDLTRLGARMVARRVELAVALGVASPGDTEAVEERETEVRADRPGSSGS